jgi:isocitrate dehydrogenase
MPAWPAGTYAVASSQREFVGLDLFVESEREPAMLGASLTAAAEGSAFRLDTLANRGVQVWPPMGGYTFVVDHFRARFLLRRPVQGDGVAEIADLLARVSRQHRWMHLEKLQRFDGTDGYAKAQGES